MINFFRRLFGEKTLESHLRQTRKFKIKGIRFVIRKIEPMDYLDGSKVMIGVYQTYEDKRKNEKANQAETNMKKVKAHFSDVILAGVVRPALSRKEEDDKICIDEIFKDWELAGELYEEIMAFAYGKKKVKKSLLNT